MKLFFYILPILFLVACDQKENPLSAQDIIDKAIERSCSGNCDNVAVEFTFRDRKYIRKRNGGIYEYQRITYVDNDIITDILNNEGFERYINDTLVQIPDSMVVKYSNSVNSVHYFSQLPFGLNDNAVNKRLLGTDTINDKVYYEIEVTFDKDEGGKDYEDVFLFWIDRADFTMDYFAYRYFTDGGGIRFREAYNERIINGIRIMDYHNYKPRSKEVDLREVDKLFTEDQLILLSKIETHDLKVTLINERSVDSQ